MTFICQMCGNGVRKVLPCTQCGALFYCSDAHRRAHAAACHHKECSRMAEQMSRSAEIFTTPFPWEFCLGHTESARDFVTSNGGSVTPLWQAECPDIVEDSADEDIWETAFKAWPVHADHDAPFPDLVKLLGLPQDLAPPPSPCGLGSTAKMASWKEYYALRRLPLESPVAVVLSTMLTLQAAITQCARAQLHSLSLQEGSSVVVHMLGVHKEALQWPLLLELCCLLPSLHLHIVLVSPSLPDGLPQHGSWASPSMQGSLQVILRQGMYHDVASELCMEYGRPQLVFCPNAGLAAYSSWRPTLEHLLQPPGPPCFFTDYCEEAALRAADACRVVLGTAGSSSSTREVKVALNPWRSPLRTITGGMALPSCSNGFLITIL